MKKILIFENLAPYGHEETFAAFSYANACLAKGHAATIALLDDGVYSVIDGQDPTDIGLPNNEDVIQDFLDLGGRILVCKTCLDRRGVSEDELIDGVETTTSYRMVDEVKEHDVSVTF